MSPVSATRRALTALAPLTFALLPAGPATAAESKLQTEKILNLGLFAGYVVACGFASEDQAAELVGRLKPGLGELAPKDEKRFDRARTAGRATKCPEGDLKRAVERGWTNYKGARFSPEAPKKVQPEQPSEPPAPSGPERGP